MATAYIALGSNLGDRHGHLLAATNTLWQRPEIQAIQMSPIYETQPVGPQNQGCFLNAAARLETRLPPDDLMTLLLEIEASRGRKDRSERERWGPRELDLDLLLFGATVTDEPGLTLPHPRMSERRFVLEPLVDLAGDVVHPVTGLSLRDMLNRLLMPDLAGAGSG